MVPLIFLKIFKGFLSLYSKAVLHGGVEPCNGGGMFALSTQIAYYTIEPIWAIGHLWSAVFIAPGPTYWTKYSRLSSHYSNCTALDLTSLDQCWASMAILSVFAASSNCETIGKVIMSSV